MFHDAAFTGFFEDSLDLMCSHMHTIDESRVPKIVIKYENNPKLWRKFGEDHCTYSIRFFAVTAGVLIRMVVFTHS
jgi:hypothetical protein